MGDDLWGPAGGYEKTLRPAKQTFQKLTPKPVRAWTKCEHDPPCFARHWCESGIRDIRDLQARLGCSIEEAIRRHRVGERAK